MKIVITYYCKNINGDVLINGDKYTNLFEHNKMCPIYANDSFPVIHFSIVNLPATLIKTIKLKTNKRKQMMTMK